MFHSLNLYLFLWLWGVLYLKIVPKTGSEGCCQIHSTGTFNYLCKTKSIISQWAQATLQDDMALAAATLALAFGGNSDSAASGVAPALAGGADGASLGVGADALPSPAPAAGVASAGAEAAGALGSGVVSAGAAADLRSHV